MKKKLSKTELGCIIIDYTEGNGNNTEIHIALERDQEDTTVFHSESVSSVGVRRRTCIVVGEDIADELQVQLRDRKSIRKAIKGMPLPRQPIIRTGGKEN